MSQVANMGLEPMTMDPYEIGWYIESADEDTYGPVSRKALRHFLEDSTITPNTLVRHCTQAEARPAADQPGMMDSLNLEVKGSALGDRLAEAWPRKKRDRLALGADSLPCAWHKRPAVLVCVRCHAPYCNSCRAKPARKQFFLCKRCQTGMWNRRFGALILDNLIFFAIPFYGILFGMLALGVDSGTSTIAVYLVQALCIGLIFFRDSLFGGAGPGKRSAGLRVVKSEDGRTPLGYGQGVVRWLSQLLPIFNLVDAMAAYSDPLMRRYGDRWAGTRVIDTEKKLAKDRQKIARRIVKKGVQPPPEFGMTMEELARIA
jgi:uncharacterized RDD family membrane protein YckC